MEGDPRNPRVPLLKKYDLPVEHLSYEYIEKCLDRKELEKIIRVLRSGEEGSYPDLLKVAEEKLKSIAPNSRVLRVETPILTKECLSKEEWSKVEKELLSWEEEMKVMDLSLNFEKSRIESVGNKNLPDVRKVVKPPPKNKTENKSKIITNNNNTKIKSGDYNAWDKYDVDKELLKMDVEEERKEEENEKKKREAKKLEKIKKVEIVDVEKENYSSMEKQVLANQAKDRGNECYKSGDLETALKYYEISIKLHSTANAYNNRAMTYLKLKQYENTVKDCNAALHLEKNNVKALYRRATAYQNMPGKKENDENDQRALKDLQQIIILEPNNKVAQADLQKLKKKLNIEDSGKKFRMAISEELINKNLNQGVDRNPIINRTDLSNERLPLTYYGPSTSTFQCEPYSLVHRDLLGSMSGQVLCKCNSNRPRQNPLCQRCGEAMCTPKPKQLKAVSTNQKKSSTKKENEIKYSLLEKRTNKIITDNKSSSFSSDVIALENKVVNDIGNSSLVKSNPMTEVKEENHLKEGEKSLEIENSKNSDLNNKPSDIKELGKSNSTVIKASKIPVDLIEKTFENNDLSKSEKEDTNPEKDSKKIVESQVEKSASDESKSINENDVVKTNESVKNNETKITENSSSQSDVNHNSKKSKSNKKKSKEHKESKSLRTHLEPVNVVYAAKYLHPTSVEPKIKKDNTADNKSEPSFINNFQYKAFVPNRKCYSTDYQKKEPALTTSSVPEKTFPTVNDKNNDLSYEGNKENIMENNNCGNNVENPTREDDVDEAKRDVLDSAFEFIRTWEELKKFDESYTKRADIIRRVRPNDLSKVIGRKLDPDMLSCILECLLRHFVETDPKRVVELLKQLPQIPTFGLASMLLADAYKKKISKLIETTEGKGFKLDEDLKKNLQLLS